MLSLLLTLSVTTAPPSPASFAGVSFYDETFVQSLSDEALAARGCCESTWPTLEFPSRGVVEHRDGEVERFTFTAKASENGFALTLRATDGTTLVRFWRWLDAERAVTNLWGGVERIASRKKPTPSDRRSAYGVALATNQFKTAFGDKKGVVFTPRADGGVSWGYAGRGTFFRCQMECTPDAGVELCLGFEESAREYVFKTEDAGVVGTPIREYDECGAREIVAGEPLRPVRPSPGR